MTEIPTIANFQADGLCRQFYESRRAMGAAAALSVADEIRRLIALRGRAVGIFSSALSQNEFLDELVNAEAIEWTRVIAFHLNEYLGMPEDAPLSLRKYLLDRLVMRVPIVEFHGLRGEAANPEAVCANYAALLKSRPPDFAVLEMGIDPPDCDSAAVNVIELNEAYRRQQVRDGAFAELEEFIDTPVKYYSSGMYMRLGFSVATAVHPEILMLDEIFAGGDAAFVEKAKVRIQNLIAGSDIMITVSHDMELVSSLCTRVILLKHGKIVGDGAPQTIIPLYLEDCKGQGGSLSS